jgi:aryl-alcohol dehydrogenase-like predicted oxidoreductase
MRNLPGSDLEVSELCLGTNVFGWTADRDDSFAVLDAYLAAGGNFLDSADSYSHFVPGNSGGESETMIGEWLAARPGARERVVIATKVAKLPEFAGLHPDNVRAAAEASLGRLGSDRIDLYYLHQEDPEVPIEETLGALGELVAEGKVRAVAASNFSPAGLAAAREAADREGLPRFVALQPEYSLVERGYEDELQGYCEREGLACIPFWGLARGFLTGKYRPGGPEIDSPRASGAAQYLEGDRGVAVLAALDEIAAAHGDAEVASVALAWLLAQSTVLSVIASARNVGQLGALLAAPRLELTGEDLARLDAASSPASS